MITGFYAALAAFALIGLILNVAFRRMRLRVSLGDGGYEELSRYIRAHGNFIETVPMALLLMLLLELSNTAFWIVHGLGFLLIASRIFHYFGLTTGKGYGRFRVWGMMCMIAIYITSACLLMLKFFGVLIFLQMPML
jgi:uncharacterized membrane protein YecN with MAPEG domain